MKWPTFSETTPNEAYNFSARSGDNRPIRVLILIGLLFVIAFLVVYFHPDNQGYSWLYGMLTASVVFKLLRLLHEWYHYWTVIPPTPPVVSRTWRVDVLTTYCAGEPYEMVVNTLHAIKRITYPHTTYLCDEANDPYLRQVCLDLDVRHITRVLKTDAKAGNINNALFEATGDICLIIDPDHVPVPDFLDHVLPYFEEPTVGFVQCVQGYYNRQQSVVAFGATEQTYSFYGPMMTSMGQYGTAQAIGANCTFRRSALDSIGGHANGLSEDMHTAMRLHANGWESVYVPLPLSFGLVPATLSAYYKQQLKWARGTFELLVTVFPMVFSGLSWRQRLHYGSLPLYYLLGSVQLLDLLIPILSLLLMRLPLKVDLLLFATAYIPLLLTGFLIRQYAQRWLIERHEAGFHLVGGILASGTWWVYVLALIYTVFRVKVPYIPTPKDDQPRNNFRLVLPNIVMSLLTLGAIGFSVYWYGRFALNNIYSQLMIGFGLLNVLILSLNIIVGQEKVLLTIGNWVQRVSARRPDFYGSIRLSSWHVRHCLYGWLRLSAVRLFGVVLLLSIGMGLFVYRKKIDPLPHLVRYATTQPFYVGVSAPGVTLPANPNASAIVPHHLTWPVQAHASIEPLSVDRTNQLPLLYLEPACAGIPTADTMRAFLKSILQGDRDEALSRFVWQVKAFRKPVLVSFMPDFDDPAKGWYVSDARDLLLMQQVWHYLVRFCRTRHASSIAWIWCPSRPSTLVSHYPGDAYVDWLGVAVVNDPALAPDHKSHSFAALYQLFHTTVRTHPDYSIRQKPILITRLGSATDINAARRWTLDAVELMRERYPTIRGIVFADQEAFERHNYRLLATQSNP
ncbi:cellulose synthase (UDP-forming) [Spirosoma sp. LMG 31447]|uniref:Cellulose synthase (UDP-forming) n=2 Tax=Spirosoma utsteinense TaxID=2585773 RepID=A0ABR6WFK8_9BACT|nr:cellulose synthase (UDP-forming) [Spirosoma utsteinense]